jgi:CheY-like chemotaxis protein
MAKPLILAVDDEPTVADNLVGIIKQAGKYDAVAAYNAKDAFAVLKKNQQLLNPNRVSLILLDIKMPDLDGLQFLEKLRKSYREDQIGVIMVTAYEDEEKWDRATSGFIAGYLKKPIDKKGLLALIDKFYSATDARYGMTLRTFEQHIEKRKEFKKGEEATP